MRNSSSPTGSTHHGAHASAMLSALDNVAVDVANSDVSGESTRGLVVPCVYRYRYREMLLTLSQEHR